MTTDNLSQTAGTKGKEKSFARHVPTVIRILLGLMFLIFGLNGFLNFMPPPKNLPENIMEISGALTKAGYLTVISGAEVIVSVLLLLNRFVPLALALLAPIIVGIITFHIFVAPATIVPAIVVLVMELYLAWAYRGAFCPMLRARTTPGMGGSGQ